MNNKEKFDEHCINFFHTHVSDLVQEIRLYNNHCKAILMKKNILANELQNQTETYYKYEILDNEYIITLTEEIYRAAFKDFMEIKKKKKF